MFSGSEKVIVMAALTRETEAVKRFIKGAPANLREAAEQDLIALGKVVDKVRLTKAV
jgi:hypothetical protein